MEIVVKLLGKIWYILQIEIMFIAMIDIAYTRTNVIKIVCSFMETYQIPYLESYRERKWGIFYKTRFRWNYKIEVSF